MSEVVCDRCNRIRLPGHFIDCQIYQTWEILNNIPNGKNFPRVLTWGLDDVAINAIKKMLENPEHRFVTLSDALVIINCHEHPDQTRGSLEELLTIFQFSEKDVLDYLVLSNLTPLGTTILVSLSKLDTRSLTPEEFSTHVKNVNIMYKELGNKYQLLKLLVKIDPELFLDRCLKPPIIEEDSENEDTRKGENVKTEDEEERKGKEEAEDEEERKGKEEAEDEEEAEEDDDEEERKGEEDDDDEEERKGEEDDAEEDAEEDDDEGEEDDAEDDDEEEEEEEEEEAEEDEEDDEEDEEDDEEEEEEESEAEEEEDEESEGEDEESEAEDEESEAEEEEEEDDKN